MRDGPRTPPKRRSTAGTALGRSWCAVDGHFSGVGGPMHSWLVLVWGRGLASRWGLGGAGGDSVGQVGFREEEDDVADGLGVSM
jgi:hypothetical protein